MARGAFSAMLIQHQSLGEGTPLVDDLVGQERELNRGGNHNDLSREAPVHQQARPCDLGAPRHDHEALPAMAAGIVGRPPDFTDCSGWVRDETHDRDSGHPRACWPLWVPSREEKYWGVTLLGERDCCALAGGFVVTGQAEDCIDAPRPIRCGPHE